MEQRGSEADQGQQNQEKTQKGSDGSVEPKACKCNVVVDRGIPTREDARQTGLDSDNNNAVRKIPVKSSLPDGVATDKGMSSREATPSTILPPNTKKRDSSTSSSDEDVVTDIPSKLRSTSREKATAPPCEDKISSNNSRKENSDFSDSNSSLDDDESDGADVVDAGLLNRSALRRQTLASQDGESGGADGVDAGLPNRSDLRQKTLPPYEDGADSVDAGLSNRSELRREALAPYEDVISKRGKKKQSLSFKNKSKFSLKGRKTTSEPAMSKFYVKSPDSSDSVRQGNTTDAKDNRNKPSQQQEEKSSRNDGRAKFYINEEG